jgi:hypothetical protein
MISTIRRYLQTDEFAGRATAEMDQAYAAQLGSYGTIVMFSHIPILEYGS